jgi:hypothetical protein
MKNLHYIILLFVGLFTLHSVQAQSTFTLSPNPASATAGVDSIDVPADAHVTNITNGTIRLKWERNVISLTPGCETAVCDPNTCWARFINTKNFDMDAGEEGEMIVHFYNNGAPCEGIVHVKVSNRDNPNDTIVGIYLFNQTSAAKDLPAANVKLFPNPTTEYFSLENAENVAAIRIFTLDGREVARFEPAATNLYSIQNQPIGNYVIALEDKNGRAFQALELKKL